MIWEEKPYVTYGSLMTTIGWRQRSVRWSSHWRWQPSTCVRWRGRWVVMKNLKKRASSREDHFPKTLFTLSHCRIAEDDGFGVLLSRSRMHIDERDKVSLAAQQQRRWKPRCVCDSWLFIVTSSVEDAHIYREHLPRVITSRNRLGLSLSKFIRHRLIAKINDKRKSRTCEALG
jgi:hypothetical protein